MRGWKRYERATMLRREGKTWAEIGAELEVSAAHARIMREVFISRAATGHIPDVELTEDELATVQRYRERGWLMKPATAGDRYAWEGYKELPTMLVNVFRFNLHGKGLVKTWVETAAYVATLHAHDLLLFENFGHVSVKVVEAWLASKGMKLQQSQPTKPKTFGWEVTFIVNPKSRRVSRTFNAKSAHAALRQAVLLLKLEPSDQLVSAEITGPTEIPKASPKPKGVVPHAATADQEQSSTRGL